MRFVAWLFFALASLASSASSQSLLDNLLEHSSTAPASFSNLAQNEALLYGTITVDASRDWIALEPQLLFSPVSVSQVSDSVFSRDRAFLDVFFQNAQDSSSVMLEDLVATGIGAMQSGAMDVFLDSRGLVSVSVDQSTTAGGQTTSVIECFARLDLAPLVQNIAYNGGEIQSRVDMVVQDVRVTTGSISTTAIGAMGSGNIATHIMGRLVGVPN